MTCPRTESNHKCYLYIFQIIIVTSSIDTHVCPRIVLESSPGHNGRKLNAILNSERDKTFIGFTIKFLSVNTSFCENCVPIF